MLITSEMIYYVRILRALYEGDILTAETIAAKENLSKFIVYKLIRRLVKAQVVESFMGVEGGYRLRMDCAEMSLMDLYKHLNLEPVVSKFMSKEASAAIYCKDKKFHQELNSIQHIMMAELEKRRLVEVF